jgi:hypothetical protein
MYRNEYNSNAGFCFVASEPQEELLLSFPANTEKPRTAGLFALSVNLFAVANPQHQDHNRFVVNLANQPVVANAVAPVFGELTFKAFADATRIVKRGNALVKIVEDALSCRAIE